MVGGSPGNPRVTRPVIAEEQANRQTGIQRDGIQVFGVWETLAGFPQAVGRFVYADVCGDNFHWQAAFLTPRPEVRREGVSNRHAIVTRSICWKPKPTAYGIAPAPSRDRHPFCYSAIRLQAISYYHLMVNFLPLWNLVTQAMHNPLVFRLCAKSRRVAYNLTSPHHFAISR